MDDFELELKNDFLDEALQLVEDVEQSFLALETDPNDRETLEHIFRLAHNLKGSAKAVGFEDMGSFTHELESFLIKIKKGEITVDAEIVDLLFRCNDHLRTMITVLKEDFSAPIDSGLLLEEIVNKSKNKKDISNAKALLEDAGKIFLDKKEEQEVPNKLPQAVNAKGKPKVIDESIRISLVRLEELINSVGEMTILHSVLIEQTRDIDSLLLKKTTHQLEKVGKEVQDISMGLRMLPIKNAFQKMQRIVRDTSRETGKLVDITLKGVETELDKTVLEMINDPLVHLIRNSVDHGIESQEKRLECGKSAEGRILLSAYQSGGKLFIEVEDDGGGIDPQKIINIAIEKGILEKGAKLPDKEAQNLIFHPGFSTKEVVTDVSGRGVGMDVVHTNIQALSGNIVIDSRVGEGTMFKIELPLTLSIIEGMVIRLDEERFVVPLSQVSETVRLENKNIRQISGIGKVLLLRDENLPLYCLSDLLEEELKEDKESILLALVVAGNNGKFAVVVDDIIGQNQVVIKKLGDEVNSLKGFSGSTILGDGKPALILELEELVKGKQEKSMSTDDSQLDQIEREVA